MGRLYSLVCVYIYIYKRTFTSCVAVFAVVVAAAVVVHVIATLGVMLTDAIFT